MKSKKQVTRIGIVFLVTLGLSGCGNPKKASSFDDVWNASLQRVQAEHSENRAYREAIKDFDAVVGEARLILDDVAPSIDKIPGTDGKVRLTRQEFESFRQSVNHMALRVPFVVIKGPVTPFDSCASDNTELRAFVLKAVKLATSFKQKFAEFESVFFQGGPFFDAERGKVSLMSHRLASAGSALQRVLDGYPGE